MELQSLLKIDAFLFEGTISTFEIVPLVYKSDKEIGSIFNNFH